MLLLLSRLILFVVSAYCLADFLLLVGFKMRLRLSHMTLGAKSCWDSGKLYILLFLITTPLLVLFPLFALGLVLAAKRPHPFFSLWKDLTAKNMETHFPLRDSKEEGEKLFCLDMSDTPHIIFLSLESFRAKNVGALGAKTGFSPHFDRLASEGILFSQFHAAGNFTSRAIIATLFGIPAAQRPLHLGSYCQSNLVGLPQILARHGYQSALIQGASLAFDHELEFFKAQGFTTILGRKELKKPASSWGVYDEYVMQEAALWLEKQTAPSFLNIYTITNHHPWIHPRKAAGYFNTFSYTDEALGNFIEDLKQKGLLEKCVFFIFGDHGQTVKEGTPPFQINQHLYQENIHVPLLIYAPGRIKEPKIIDTVASQMDLPSTVCDLMNLTDAHHGLGKSLARKSDAPIYFNHPFDLPCIGAREGDWKYLKQEGKEELYNLRADPEEKENRISEWNPLREKTLRYFEELDQFYFGKLEKVTSPRTLNFSNSVKIDDEKLMEVANDHPELSVLSLNHCLLLSNGAISELLNKCRKIEKLYINGLDVTGDGWEGSEDLVHLHAMDCPKLKTEWLQKLPNLNVLKLGSTDLSDEDLMAMAKTNRSLERLSLACLPKITDLGLNALLKANPRLQIVSLEGCPQISDEAFREVEIPHRFVLQ